MTSRRIPNAASGLKSRLISISKWFNHQRTSKQPLLLMDLRSSESYEKRRLRSVKKTGGDTSQNLVAATLPIDVLRERSFELPSRHVEFSILVHPSNLDQAEEFLLGPRERKDGHKRTRPFKPWNISDVLLDEEILWTEAENLGILAGNNDESKQYKKQKVDDKSTPIPLSPSSFDDFPQPRLWQPDPMVENTLLPLLKELDDTIDGQQVWDLGSGAGRDLIFLAEELFASRSPLTSMLQLIGIDHRYNEKETRITTEFCNRRGVSSVTRLLKLDCSKWDLIKKEIQTQHEGTENELSNHVAVIYAVRFWKPALFEEIANCVDVNIIKPGTIVAMSNFCKPNEGASWDFQNPNPSVVLERSHLNAIFSKHGTWDILHDEIVNEPDYGRPMIHFVAKRKQ